MQNYYRAVPKAREMDQSSSSAREKCQLLLGLLNIGQPDTWQGRLGDAILTAQEEVESFRQDFQEHSKGNTIRPLDLRPLVSVHFQPFGKRNSFMIFMLQIVHTQNAS